MKISAGCSEMKRGHLTERLKAFRYPKFTGIVDYSYKGELTKKGA